MNHHWIVPVVVIDCGSEPEATVGLPMLAKGRPSRSCSCSDEPFLSDVDQHPFRKIQTLEKLPSRMKNLDHVTFRQLHHTYGPECILRMPAVDSYNIALDDVSGSGAHDDEIVPSCNLLVTYQCGKLWFENKGKDDGVCLIIIDLAFFGKLYQSSGPGGRSRCARRHRIDRMQAGERSKCPGGVALRGTPVVPCEAGPGKAPRSPPTARSRGGPAAPRRTGGTRRVLPHISPARRRWP
jgi:hypothetical protein